MHLLEKAPSKLNIITLVMISVISANGFAEDAYTFDDTFIKGKHSKADFSKYTSDELTEGDYSLDVYTNGEWKGKYDLSVKKQDDGSFGICYDEKMLTQFGISTDQLNSSLAKTTGYCGTLKSWNGSPDIRDRIVKSTFKLEITIPQIYENDLYKDFVDPSRWDSGVPALNIGWTGNIWSAHYSGENGGDSTTGYLGLNTNATAKGWVLKNRSQLTWDQSEGSKFTSTQLYLERPIPTLKSVLSMGQISSSGELFDSTSLRGALLRTDVGMSPDLMANFSPEIRGNAQSNALVTVKQNNRIVYETTVTPGPFVLTDISPGNYGSDLDVTIKESDGTETHFVVPFNSGSKLLHPGMFKYELSAGKPDVSSLTQKPTVYQGSVQYGLNNYVTGYGGVTGFNRYTAYLVGAGLNTPLGGFSLDTTTSKLKTKNISSRGNMYRASYTRGFEKTNTNLSFVGMKYSDKGYYSLGNALSVNNDYLRTIRTEKTNVSISVSQKLPDNWGNIYLSGRMVDYWGTGKKQKQYQLNYSNRYGKLSYSVSVQRLKTTYRGDIKNDTQIGLNFSIPLYSSSTRSSYVSSHTKFENGRYANTQVGLSGVMNGETNASYGLNANLGDTRDVSLNGGMNTRWAKIDGGYSQGSRYRQASFSGSGSIIAHSGGIIATPDSGETIAIVEAKGGAGAKLAASLGGKIDSNGFGVITTLRPYRVNNIEIDPKGSSDKVYFNDTIKQVVPYAGSTVKVVFDTEIQDNLMFKGKFKNGDTFPFGATIYNTRGAEIGMVGQGGQVFIRDASQPKAVLKWKEGSCTFTLPKHNGEVICN